MDYNYVFSSPSLALPQRLHELRSLMESVASERYRVDVGNTVGLCPGWQAAECSPRDRKINNRNYILEDYCRSFKGMVCTGSG